MAADWAWNGSQTISYISEQDGPKGCDKEPKAHPHFYSTKRWVMSAKQPITGRCFCVLRAENGSIVGLHLLLLWEGTQSGLFLPEDEQEMG